MLGAGSRLSRFRGCQHEELDHSRLVILDDSIGMAIGTIGPAAAFFKSRSRKHRTDIFCAQAVEVRQFRAELPRTIVPPMQIPEAVGNDERAVLAQDAACERQ